MPRQLESFHDALGAVIQEIARAKLTMDADIEFLGMLESSILEHLRNPDLSPEGVATAGAQPGASAAQMAEGQGGPVAVEQSPTRLPAQSADVGGMTEELSRMMAGS